MLRVEAAYARTAAEASNADEDVLVPCAELEGEEAAAADGWDGEEERDVLEAGDAALVVGLLRAAKRTASDVVKHRDRTPKGTEMAWPPIRCRAKRINGWMGTALLMTESPFRRRRNEEEDDDHDESDKVVLLLNVHTNEMPTPLKHAPPTKESRVCGFSAAQRRAAYYQCQQRQVLVSSRGLPYWVINMLIGFA